MVPGVLESVGLLPEDLPAGGWTLAEGPQPEGNLHFGRQAACPQLCLDELGRHGGRLVEHGGCDGRAAGRCHGALLQQSLLGTHTVLYHCKASASLGSTDRQVGSHLQMSLRWRLTVRQFASFGDWDQARVEISLKTNVTRTYP